MKKDAKSKALKAKMGKKSDSEIKNAKRLPQTGHASARAMRAVHQMRKEGKKS